MEKRAGSVHFGLKTIIPWGTTFKGQRIEDILTSKGGIEYVKWMHEQTDNMVVEPEVLVRLYDEPTTIPTFYHLPANDRGLPLIIAEALIDFIKRNRGKPIIIK